jgi:hypothetical protein
LKPFSKPRNPFCFTVEKIEAQSDRNGTTVSKSYLLLKQTDQMTTLHIVFHGNCIDGWGAAYIAQSDVGALTEKAGLPYESVADVQMWAISPNQSWTWSKIPVRGCHVLLLDVSLPASWLSTWERAALSVHCVDHHVSSVPVWTGREDRAVLCMDRCATWLTWELVHPEEAVPDWVAFVDRIDRWCDVTEEDRAVRELLHPIAQMPVKGQFDEALTQMHAFILRYTYPSLRALQAEQGRAALALKTAALQKALGERPTCQVSVDVEKCALWSLPADWLGQKVFVLNSTGVQVDSTEAAAALFELHADVNVFVNYRHKSYVNRRGIVEKSIVYSVRAREGCGLDLTAGAVFAGHPCAAGGARPLAVGAAFVIETM